MEGGKKPGNRLKTAGLVVACGLTGIVAVALGLMLADALLIYAMERVRAVSRCSTLWRARSREGIWLSL